MGKTLINQIGKDLNIYPFSGECIDSYEKRVLYSGLAHWMKIILLDHFENSGTEPHSISKHHLYTRFSSVIHQYSELFPQYETWFFSERRDKTRVDLVHLMRNRLLDADEMQELGLNGNVSMTYPKAIKLSEEITRQIGIQNQLPITYTGIATLIPNCTGEVVKTCCDSTSMDIFTKYLAGKKWFNVVEVEQKEFFDPKLQTDTFYKGWIDIVPEEPLFLSKIPIKFGMDKFFVERKTEYNHVCCEVEDFVVQSGEFKYFMLALRSKYNNPLKIHVKKGTDHFRLKRYVTSFPYPEEAWFITFGWPLSSIADTQEWIFSLKFLPHIQELSKKLCITIEYTDVGD